MFAKGAFRSDQPTHQDTAALSNPGSISPSQVHSLVLWHWLRECDLSLTWVLELDSLIDRFSRLEFYIENGPFQMTESGYRTVRCFPTIEFSEETGKSNLRLEVNFKVESFGENLFNHYAGFVVCDWQGNWLHRVQSAWLREHGGILALLCSNQDRTELHCDDRYAHRPDVPWLVHCGDSEKESHSRTNWKDGDRIGFKLFTKSREIWVYRNGVCLGLGFRVKPGCQYLSPVVQLYNAGITVSMDSGL